MTTPTTTHVRFTRLAEGVWAAGAMRVERTRANGFRLYVDGARYPEHYTSREAAFRAADELAAADQGALFDEAGDPLDGFMRPYPFIWTRNATDRPKVFEYTAERYTIRKGSLSAWTLTLDTDCYVGAFKTLAAAKRAADDHHAERAAAIYRGEPDPADVTVDADQDDTVEAEVLDEPATHTLIVVPCAAAKLDEPAPARELYTSPNFRHTLAAAEAEAAATERDLDVPARVVILSAKYGLLELDEVIPPYDVTMSDAGSVEALELADQLRALDAASVVMMLPSAYRTRLAEGARLANTLGADVDVHDAYEAAPFIGHRRGVASSLIRHAGRDLAATTPADAELAARDAFNRDHDPRDMRRWDELTHDERAAYYAEAGHPAPAADPVDDRADRAAELRAMPVATFVPFGGSGYVKRDRGDWTEVASSPQRFTSFELATIGVDPATAQLPADPEPEALPLELPAQQSRRELVREAERAAGEAEDAADAAANVARDADRSAAAARARAHAHAAGKAAHVANVAAIAARTPDASELAATAGAHADRAWRTVEDADSVACDACWARAERAVLEDAEAAGRRFVYAGTRELAVRRRIVTDQAVRCRMHNPDAPDGMDADHDDALPLDELAGDSEGPAPVAWSHAACEHPTTPAARRACRRARRAAGLIPTTRTEQHEPDARPSDRSRSRFARLDPARAAGRRRDPGSPGADPRSS